MFGEYEQFREMALEPAEHGVPVLWRQDVVLRHTLPHQEVQRRLDAHCVMGGLILSIGVEL